MASKKGALAHLTIAEKRVRERRSSEVLVEIGIAKTEVAGLREPAPVTPPPVEPPPSTEPKGYEYWGKKVADFGANFVKGGCFDTEIGGRPAIAFKVANGDEPVKTGNPRAELIGVKNNAPRYGNGAEFWIKGAVYFPTDFPAYTGWMTILSVYGAPASGPAPWHMSVLDGNKIGWQSPAGSLVWQQPLVKGRWYDILHHHRMGTGVTIETWLNGELADARTANTWTSTNNQESNIVKLDQYRLKDSIPGTATMYHGGLILGPTRASVGG